MSASSHWLWPKSLHKPTPDFPYHGMTMFLYYVHPVPILHFHKSWSWNQQYRWPLPVLPCKSEYLRKLHSLVSYPANNHLYVQSQFIIHNLIIRNRLHSSRAVTFNVRIQAFIQPCSNSSRMRQMVPSFLINHIAYSISIAEHGILTLFFHALPKSERIYILI